MRNLAPVKKAEDELSLRKEDDTTTARHSTRGCPLCGGESVSCGPIAHMKPTVVAGVPVELGESKYFLRRCVACDFRFKDPPIPQEKLLECYKAASSKNWGDGEKPEERSYETYLTLLRKYSPNGDILDIGCYTGLLLNYIGDQWSRYAIEPSEKAGLKAQEKGIKILGRTLEEVQSQNRLFDCIFSVDVLEHIPAPAEHIDQILSLLKPEGVFILSTGNASAFTWKVLGSHHWYAAYPEHISFYSPACLKRFLDDRGFKIIETIHFRHLLRSFLFRSAERFKVFLFWLALAAHKIFPNPITRVTETRGSPPWLTACDHMIIVIRRQP